MRTMDSLKAATLLVALLSLTASLRAQTFSGSNAPGASSDFNFSLGANSTNLSVVVPGSSGGYSDLLLRRDSPPTDSTFDYASALPGQTNAIHLEIPQLTAGTYFIRVRTPVSSPAHTFTVLVQTNVPDMRSNNRPVSKPLGEQVSGQISSNQRQYFRFGLTSNASVRVTLDSSQASPDLYLHRDQLPSDVVYLRRSTGLTNDSIAMLDTEATTGSYFIGVFSPAGSPTNVPFTLRIVSNPIPSLGWDLGTTHEGTLVQSNFTTTATDYYYKITTANPSLGAWRTALKVFEGEANLYLSRGTLPTVAQSDFKSERVGSDGFVLSSAQFAPNEVWYILVRASANSRWTLVSGSPFVQDLGMVMADDSSGSGEVVIGPEGMRFFSAQVPADMLAWRLWLNGGTNTIVLRKTSLPVGVAGSELSQVGQALVAPPYLTGGQQYFIGIIGNPGTTNRLDSRQQPIINLAYGSTTANVVTGFPYTTYRIQVPPQQIAWQISLPSTNGNPNVSVRRNSVPNENNNDALSELATAITDNIALVPPVLSDGTFYITVWATNTHQYVLENGPAVVTDINYTGTIANNDPDRVGWRFFRVADINQQLGTLGWELVLSNFAPGTRIALRRNAAPSTWSFRNPGFGSPVYYDVISTAEILQRPGHQADVWYVGIYNPTNKLGGFTLTTREIQTQPLTDSVPLRLTNNPPGLWQFFSLDILSSGGGGGGGGGGNAILGWDLRLTDVINNPVFVVRRDALPESLSSSVAPNATNWPTRAQWAAGVDWTGRTMPTTGTTNETGRILAMGMGRPLEPGRYYIGVQSSPAYPQPTSYTLLSRWIGTNQAIPIIRSLSWFGDGHTNTVAPRFADYYTVEVPPNRRSFKVHLRTVSGEAMMVVSKDTLPNVAGAVGNPIINSAGKNVQKIADEYLTVLPPRGSNFVQPGTYYIAVVGEGQNPPDNTRIGTGTSTYILETLGEIAEPNIGLLGMSNLVVSGSLFGGEVAAYHFSVLPGVFGFWLDVDDHAGNPIAVARAGLNLIDPGLGSSVVPPEPYGNDGGEINSGNDATAAQFIIASNPGDEETVMVKARQFGLPGVFPDASYTIHIDEIVPQQLVFDGGTVNIVNQDPRRGSFFYVDVPDDAEGWDVRITNVTSGNPQLVVGRDLLPIFLTTSGISPATQTTWPLAARWAAGRDWTERSFNAQGVSEDGRILAMGMGRPLEPGRYYIGVLSGGGTGMSFSISSRGIGDGYSIPIMPLNFNGGSFAGTGLRPREAAYFRVDVPANVPNWKVHLATAASGEALLIASKDTLPNVLANSISPAANSAGRKMQKAGEEYFLMLPPPGASNIVSGTYYLAVVGEGASPQPGRVGSGTTDFTLTSRGVAPVRNLGQLGFNDLVETNTVAGGDTQIYQFTVPAATLALEARIENAIGNPVMVLRQGALVPAPGAGQSIPPDSYGHDGGENSGLFVHNALISVANPTNTLCTLIVMARQVAGGVYTNATYTLRLNASGSTTVDFEGSSFPISNQAAQTWKYFRITVPPATLGWDLRLLNATSGAPRMVIRRDSLPNAVGTGPWPTPGAASSWPTNAQWAPGQDWTRRSQSAADPNINEDGRVFAVGMGRPLEPGTYFVGVFNASPSAATSYTIQSRGLGPGFSIPVIDVPFVGTASGTLPGREAAYLRVYVPSNTPSWKVKLTGVTGESMLVALRGYLPNIDLNQIFGSLANGKGMQKPGNEHFVLLPATGQTNITAGTNYFAVVSEGVNPPNPSRLGSGSSTFTFESVGTVPTNELGLLTSEDILHPDSVEGGEMKLYQFAVPSGMLGLKLRLENRVGNPTFVFRHGDKTPDPGAAVPGGDAYGNEGGYASSDGHTTLYTVPNPLPGIYTLVVKGRPLNSIYTDATYTLRLQEMLVPELNFSAPLNTNGLPNSVSGVLEDNERVFYKFVIPATIDGQPVIGWKLNLVQSSGLASMRVRKDLLPTDVNAFTQMPFTTAQAIIVPTFLTNGVWYVEVKGAGSTAFTLTSSALSLERPPWMMPAPGEPTQTPGVLPPLFADTVIDTNGVPSAEPSTFLEQGFLHYYAVSVPETNHGLIRAALEAISGNPDLYLRYGAPPTLYHNPQGAGGTIYDRAMLATTTEYANWVPLDGKLETKLKPGLWYIAVRAVGNANARYRLKLSIGTITDLPLNAPDLTNQLVAGGDWRYYRFTAPSSLPSGFNFAFSQQSGDVVVHVRDTVPPGTGLGAGDFRDWTIDAKNNAPYGSFDAPGAYAFAAPPVRPGAVYYLGVRALSDSVFTIRATTNGAPTVEPELIPFYGGLVVTNLAPGAQAFYRIDVPAEATRWKHTATHAIGLYLGIEQGTIPRPGSEDWRNIPGIANSGLNQYLLTGWPWLPRQSYFLVISNSTAQVQEVVFAMDGKNAATDDNDVDALPDAWELQYFGNTGVQSSAGDPDRDGVTNYDEFTEGTNPTDATSFQARLVTTALNGSVVRSPNAQTYPLNAQVILTATPAPGYAFIAWAGNASGRENPLVVTMDGHKAIGATFKLAGDDFVTALPLSGISASAVASNVGMTKEPGEPNHAGNPGGKSIWWRWAAPGSGSATITTAGSTFNTVLGVYTGTSVSNLSVVASDNNSGGTTNRSIVQFSAVAGTTYHIAVDGYNGASSRVNLSVALGNISGLRPDLRSMTRLGDGRAEFMITADANRTYNIEASTNLIDWTPLDTVTTDATGSGRFTDAQATAFTQRFYRARQ